MWMMMPRGRLRKRLCMGLLIVFPLLCGLFVPGCIANKMIFVPPPATYRDGGEVLKLTTDDGARISALYLRNPAAEYTILFSHGNACDLGGMVPFLERMRAAGFSVMAYDYHGYGTSAGRPTERNTYRDIDGAWRYLVSERKTPPEKIILHGQSVGAGPSVDLATRENAGGLVMESGFVSAYRVMTRWPLIPFDKFNNLRKIGKVNCPVMIIHGTADGIIPPWHGQKLYDRAAEPKRAIWVKGAGHNNLAHVAGEGYWEQLRRFAAGQPPS